MEIVEEPLGRGRDEGAFPDILGEVAIRRLERVRVIAQPGVDAARVTLFGVDGEVRRQGKRSLLEPL